MKSFLCFLVSLVLVVAFASCGGQRKLTYFEGSFDTASLSMAIPPEPVIQNGDLLSIVVFSDNPQATALYNQPVAGVGDNIGTSATAPFSPQTQSAGYLVDHNGNIQFQGLGNLHVQGLTKPQLVELLDSKLKDTLLSNPYYNIRFLNFKVTVIGDVNRPGVYSVPAERVSIMEAIGLAGDMTLYGKRENVTIIREVDGKRQFGTIDLTKPEAMASPYFYLRQNDMIIVNAAKNKASSQDLTTLRNVSIATSVISALGIIISLITR
ncbi:MAG TPA: polysaccharide biosynthesis/export family protein [Flavisolibacter sp.]|nr:polysaccharide biosynthesis/export family protein [Flavisolibacter sp.]